MNSASSAASAKNLWWINLLLQKMTTSTAPIVTIKTSLLAAMGVVNHLEEVNNVSEKNLSFILNLERKSTCKK